MNTSDESKLFQTDAQLAQKEAQARKAVLTKTIGSPIQLASRAIKLRVRGQDAWVAESGWVVRRVCLHTGKTKRVYKGHQGPCTSLDFYQLTTGTSRRDLMVTGSWDKTIKVWDVESGEMLSSTPAHTDFVKSLLVIPQLDILLSGSSDKTIAIWSLSSLSADGPLNLPLTRLDQLKSHTRPVDSFALSHVNAGGLATVYAGDSMGVIRTWLFRRATGSSNADANKVQVIQGPDLPGHHTNITRLVMDGDQGLISCSMDSQVLYHPLDQDQDRTQTANEPIRPALSIPNPLYPETTPVRSLLLLPSTFHPSPLLLCGAADQDIRVFDLSSTLESAGRSSHTHTAGQGRAKEVSRIRGHWADVIDLDVWVKQVEGGKKEAWVVSASLDETLRRWSMQDVLHPPPIPREEVVETTKKSLMTAEEERELAELMGSDIEDDV